MQQPDSTNDPTGPADQGAHGTGWHPRVPGELSLRIKTIGGSTGSTVVVWVSGDIDLASVPALRDVLDLAFEGGTHLVVDLADVDFINGAGVTALAEAADHVRRGGGTFVVRRPSPISRKVLRILGLDPLCGEAG